MRRLLVVAGCVLAAVLRVAPAGAEGSGAGAGQDEGYVVTPDGVRLHYRIVGKGSSAVLVPLAAWLSPELDALANSRRVVYYDPRGRGASDRVTEPAQLGIERDIEDFETVRTRLGLGRVSLVGWSYLGAAVALYASRHPEHVDRVVQIGALQPAKAAPYSYDLLPSQRPAPSGLAELEARRAEGMDLTDPAGYCRLALRLRMLPENVGDPGSIARLKADPCRFDNEWPWNLSRSLGLVIGALGDWDWREAARRVKAPTLVVHGDRDRVPLPGGEEWARLIPGARILVLRGAGHAAWLDAPGLIPAVGRFLSGTWPEDAALPPP